MVKNVKILHFLQNDMWNTLNWFNFLFLKWNKQDAALVWNSYQYNKYVDNNKICLLFTKRGFLSVQPPNLVYIISTLKYNYQNESRHDNTQLFKTDDLQTDILIYVINWLINVRVNWSGNMWNKR